MKANTECRPIVTGDFTQNEVMKYFDYEIHNELTNARYLHENGLFVVEDCAQAILSKYKYKSSGSWGQVGCFSAHPLKNLNAIGDAGYLTTNDKNIYTKIKNLRTHGMEDSRDNVKNFGYVSRMDNLQAAILNFRLKNLKKILKRVHRES